MDGCLELPSTRNPSPTASIAIGIDGDSMKENLEEGSILEIVTTSCFQELVKLSGLARKELKQKGSSRY
jgi:hypothetical protein